MSSFIKTVTYVPLYDRTYVPLKDEMYSPLRARLVNLEDLEDFALMDLREVIPNFTIPEGHEVTYKCKPGQSPFSNYDVKELIIMTDPKNINFVGCTKD